MDEKLSRILQDPPQVSPLIGRFQVQEQDKKLIEPLNLKKKGRQCPECHYQHKENEDTDGVCIVCGFQF